MAEQFKVIFTGHLHDGVTSEQAAEQFASRFNCGLDRATRLVQSSRDVVIKAGIDRQKAEKYAAALESLGMEARIDGALVLQLEGDEPEAPAATAFNQTTASVSGGANLAMADSDTVTSAGSPRVCPKCASDEIEDDKCLGCGIIISKYLALQAEAPNGQVMGHVSAAPVTADENGAGKESTEETGAVTDDATSPPQKPEVVYQMGSANPYQAPHANLHEATEPGDMTGPASVSAGNGWRWLAEAFLYFKRNPVAWIMTFLAWILISVIVSFIPLVGSLVIWLVSPVITAGYMLGCQEQEEGGDFQFGHLFAGFSQNLGQLILVGVLYLVGTVAIGVGIAFFAGGAALLFGNVAGAGMGPEVMSAVLLPMLLAMAAIIPLIMAYWFAPVLVVLHGMSAISAMKTSFMGCLKNVLPFLIYGVMLTILFVLATIPFGLGWLIVMPMMVASIYTAYRDIFFG